MEDHLRRRAGRQPVPKEERTMRYRSFYSFRQLGEVVWRRTAPTLLVLAVAAALMAPSGVRAGGSLTNQTPGVGNAAQVHLVYTDKSGSHQDIDLASAQQPLLSVLPTDLQQLQSSPFLTTALGDAFGQLWSSLQSQDCGSITTQITSDIHTSDNTAYAVNACSFGPIASLTATQQSQWNLPEQWDPVTGQRLLLDYYVPDNSVAFKVSSPYTCQNSNLVCAGDPQYTVVFDMHILVMLTSPDPSSLQCPLTVTAVQTLVINSVLGGDVSGAIKDALLQAAAQYGVAAGVSLAAGEPIVTLASVVGAVVQTAGQLAGIGVAAAGNDHLRDTVSSDLSYVTVPGAADLSSVPALQGFNTFSQGCQAAWKLGFSTLDAAATSDGDLRFTLTAPAALAPTLQDAISQENGQPTLFHPMIAASESQVKAGGKLTITGSYFETPESTQIQISWGDTLAGSSINDSDIRWGPRGGQLQTVAKPRQSADNAATYEPTGLSPSTTYQFQVRDCNPLTCSPWSAEKDITTAAGGADQVTAYLDSIPVSNQIGTGTVKGDGTFSVDVTIPSGTPSGQHTILAVTGGGQQAAQQISPRQLVSSTAALALTAGAPNASGTANRTANATVNPNAIAELSSATANTPSAPSTFLNNAATGAIANLPAGGSGQQASTAVTVIGTGQNLQPVIQVIDPQTNQVYTSAEEGTAFTLRGSGFSAGQVNLTLDTASGQALGFASAGADGTFQVKLTMPMGTTGNRTLVATESVNGQSIQATDNVFVQMLPR
jgi:hypothetical protein